MTINLGLGISTGNGTSNANQTITGNDASNVLRGGNGNDRITGGAGNDVIHAGAGNDQVDAGAGNDIVFGGDGNDSILGGAGNDSLYGDGGNDTLTGNQGDDKLYGGTDNDRLDGGDGVDTMEGGTGNDTYVVDNARDVVTELGSQGIDTVESFITTTLGANVENLALQGNANINGFGNAGANVISDNAGNNMLVGGLGADIIRLGAGKDSVLFNSALGNGNIDRIEGFNVADDHIKLEDAVFRAVGPANSWLAADAFWTGPSAHDASDRIIYDRVSGALYYDADGTGSAAQVQFATLAPGLDLTSRDFWIG